YGVDVETFVGSLVALRMMRAVPPPAEAEPPSMRRIVEGAAYARSRPELVGTYAVDIVAMLFGMPEALFPAVASDLGGAGALGLLFAAPAVGSLASVPFSIVSGGLMCVAGVAVCIALLPAFWRYDSRGAQP